MYNILFLSIQFNRNLILQRSIIQNQIVAILCGTFFIQEPKDALNMKKRKL